MKKLATLAIVFAIATLGVKAQDMGSTVVLLNYNSLQKKVIKSDAEILDAKKNVKATTWQKRGDLYVDVFNIGLEQTSEGMDQSMLKLFYDDPSNIESITHDDGSLEETFVYEHMKYVFVDGALQTWEQIDPIHENPLVVSIEAYKKALELDEKGKVGEKVKEKLIEVKTLLKRQGINHYYSERYDKALGSFENVLVVNDIDLFAGEFDTIMVQYSGIISREIAGKTDDDELYLKAIKYYKELAAIDFGGPNTYLQIKIDYLAIQDTASALQTMLDAYAKYPDSVNVISNVADIYIQLKDIDTGIGFMEKCIEHDPLKADSYYWQGRMLINKEGTEFIERAISSYEKAIELSPSVYYFSYDLGYIYYLQGADFYERSNAEDHDPTREKLIELGKERYELAYPILENAYELNTDNMSIKLETLDLLQRIYYKEQMMEDYNRVKELKSNM